jgi:hypothetical protein
VLYHSSQSKSLSFAGLEIAEQKLFVIIEKLLLATDALVHSYFQPNSGETKCEKNAIFSLVSTTAM